ncbi:MAG: hypothetical protein Q9167_007493 [Letrouitia subvulpina]
MLFNENTKPSRLLGTVEPPLLQREPPHSKTQQSGYDENRLNLRSPPRKSVDVFEDTSKRPNMHKKSKSSVSLKSLMGNDKAKTPRSKSISRDEPIDLGKQKPSTGLSALLSPRKPSKPSKIEVNLCKKDKENQTPPSTAAMPPPPIWAQFATQDVHNNSKSVKVPLNDRVVAENELLNHDHKAHSSSRPYGFQTSYQQEIAQKETSKPRPKSEAIVPSHSIASIAETFSAFRKHRARDTSQLLASEKTQITSKRTPQYEADSPIKTHQPSKDTAIIQGKEIGQMPGSDAIPRGRGTNVKAAVAALNSSTPQPPSNADKGKYAHALDTKAIEKEFENLLNLRDKMRLLNANIKADFIKKDKTTSGSVSSTGSSASARSESTVCSRPATAQRSLTDKQPYSADIKTAGNPENPESPKKSRPRSRTFTFSKGDSSTKKPRSDRSKSRGRSKSRERKSEEVSRSHTIEFASKSSIFSRPSKPILPEEFVSYLRKTTKPEAVETEKVHKLRQLLRNETVGWVDDFIEKGGIVELIGLLNRILEVEWREEHEDTLLHETLLCIKGLSTTSRALEYLSEIESALFPTLISMLFDEERKGPSEYTTRNIVISLLFTYLSNSTPSECSTRARTLLSYLRDPAKPENSRPPGFITSIYHPRPYRMWCKEMVNVTKEVFWVFIHNVNVIPYPTDTNDTESYRATHFPRERPPIPAAPYIGGVEWDATNYLTTHLDLLNGLLASLPRREERNNLRLELRDSGFEKCMGVSLRTCKEKWYSYVHAALSTWVGAAMADGWLVKEVREGPTRDDVVRQSPKKGKNEAPPRLEMPRLDLGVEEGKLDGGEWL